MIRYSLFMSVAIRKLSFQLTIGEDIKQVSCFTKSNILIIFNFFYQSRVEFTSPTPSIHVAHSTYYGHLYIWSGYPSPKAAKIDYSALFSFDPPSAFLFLSCLVGAVALMKLFTHFSSKLGLDTVSEEPVNIPTRYHLS